VRRLVPYLASAPLVAGVGVLVWTVTSLSAVRVVPPFAFVAAGVAGFGLGRHRPGGNADLFSLVGVALIALAVVCLPFVTEPWARVGFPLFGVLGVGLAGYGVGHRADGEWALTRDLGRDESESGRPWLDDVDTDTDLRERDRRE